MAFWYLAHDNELLIDLDDYTRPARTKTGATQGRWGEMYFRRRLRTAETSGLLKVCRRILQRSNTRQHYHAIVVLAEPMDIFQRLAWQEHLGSDLLRSRCDIMRAARRIPHPSLLIRSTPFKNYRPADRECPCIRKHDTDEQYRLGDAACPVWRELRGITPWELFGRPYQGTERFVALPEGDVPLELILKIDNE